LALPTDDWNWAEFLADAKALTKRDKKKGTTSRWGFADDWGMVEPWIYCGGARWVDNPQNPTAYTFNNPTFASALQFRADLILKHKVMPGPSNITAMGGMGSSDLFMNGTVAMFLSGLWKTPAFREIKTFDWDVAMFPKGPGGHRGYQDGGSGYGILKSSKNKKAAWELVKYIGGPEGVKKLTATGLSQPALKNVGESPIFLDGQKPANKKMLLKAEEYGVYEPMASNWKEVRDGFITPTFDQIWSGKITAARRRRPSRSYGAS
jgi:multiple sugar transport system substrate-binding protein